MLLEIPDSHVTVRAFNSLATNQSKISTQQISRYCCRLLNNSVLIFLKIIIENCTPSLLRHTSGTHWFLPILNAHKMINSS